MFQVGPLVEAEGTQPILLRTGHHQSPEWFGANPIPYSRAVALPKPSPNPSDPLEAAEEFSLIFDNIFKLRLVFTSCLSFTMLTPALV
jgi:hypothetical protein